MTTRALEEAEGEDGEDEEVVVVRVLPRPRKRRTSLAAVLKEVRSEVGEGQVTGEGEAKGRTSLLDQVHECYEHLFNDLMRAMI